MSTAITTSRIIIISRNKKVDTDALAVALKGVESEKGMVAFGVYGGNATTVAEFLHKQGNEVDSFGTHTDEDYLRLVVEYARQFPVVYAMCEEKDIDHIYSELTHFTKNVHIIHE